MRVIKRLGFYGAQPAVFLPSASDFSSAGYIHFPANELFCLTFNQYCQSRALLNRAAWLRLTVHFLLPYAPMAGVVFPGDDGARRQFPLVRIIKNQATIAV
jgi:hypothetical protein